MSKFIAGIMIAGLCCLGGQALADDITVEYNAVTERVDNTTIEGEVIYTVVEGTLEDYDVVCQGTALTCETVVPPGVCMSFAAAATETATGITGDPSDFVTHCALSISQPRKVIITITIQ